MVFRIKCEQVSIKHIPIYVKYLRMNISYVCIILHQKFYKKEFLAGLVLEAQFIFYSTYK